NERLLSTHLTTRVWPIRMNVLVLNQSRDPHRTSKPIMLGLVYTHCVKPAAWQIDIGMKINKPFSFDGLDQFLNAIAKRFIGRVIKHMNAWKLLRDCNRVVGASCIPKEQPVHWNFPVYRDEVLFPQLVRG